MPLFKVSTHDSSSPSGSLELEAAQDLVKLPSTLGRLPGLSRRDKIPLGPVSTYRLYHQDFYQSRKFERDLLRPRKVEAPMIKLTIKFERGGILMRSSRGLPLASLTRMITPTGIWNLNLSGFDIS